MPASQPGPNMGKRKTEQYGKEILSLVLDFCSKEGLSAKQEIIEEIKKPPKKDTKTISFELFRQGKTIEQIAGIREMANSTIEGHLAHFVGTGELKLKQFVDTKTAGIISDYFLANPDGGLSKAKESLDDSITYGELKFVLKHLEYLGKL